MRLKVLNGYQIKFASGLIFILRISFQKFLNICLEIIEYAVFNSKLEDSYFVIFVRRFVHRTFIVPSTSLGTGVFVNWKTGHSQRENV